MFPKSRETELALARKFVANLSPESQIDKSDDLAVLDAWRSYCEANNMDPATATALEPIPLRDPAYDGPMGIFEDYDPN